MPEPYWLLIGRVLKSGRMSNSYKPALLRALADYGASGRTARSVQWEWFAARFVNYYWPLAVRYRVRQATDPLKEPIVVRQIKELDVGPRVTVDQYRRRNKADFDAMISRLAKPGPDCCLDEVVPRFHKVGGDPPARLYEEHGTDILIQPDALTFLQNHHQVLRMLAIGRWVRFTEKFAFAPRLWEKIEGQATRCSLSRQRAVLSDLDLARWCFYCHSPLLADWDVDHFLPWSFVLEDRLWNLVPSCKSCNGQKSDGISVEYLGALLERNKAIFSLHDKPGIESLVNRDIKEWTPDDLGEHISLLCRTAIAEGFPEWAG